jgi:hypothetical protein
MVVEKTNNPAESVTKRIAIVVVTIISKDPSLEFKKEFKVSFR